jgi:DNA-binding transcriptional LysR family regulator
MRGWTCPCMTGHAVTLRLAIKIFAQKLTTAGCSKLHVATSAMKLKLLARERLGIAVLPAFLITDDLADGGLV